MRKLIKLAECVGKTVEGAIDRDFMLAIHFTDGTSFAVTAGDQDSTIKTDDGVFSLYDKVELGVMTPEERAEADRRRVAETAAWKAENERKELARLKAKYEPSGEPGEVEGK